MQVTVDRTMVYSLRSTCFYAAAAAAAFSITSTTSHSYVYSVASDLVASSRRPPLPPPALRPPPLRRLPSLTGTQIQESHPYGSWHKSRITLMALDYGKFGIFLIMGHAGHISSTP